MHLDSPKIENFCFVDLQWLCDVLTHVVSLEYDCKSLFIQSTVRCHVDNMCIFIHRYPH